LRLPAKTPGAPGAAARQPQPAAPQPVPPPASAAVRSAGSDAVGGGFDAARIAAIREEIRAGRYQVHPERIADAMIDSVRELLAKAPPR